MVFCYGVFFVAWKLQSPFIVIVCDLIYLLTWSNQFYYFFPQDDINAMELEDDKRDLISREISKFRDTHKVTHYFLFFLSLLFLA